MAMHDGDRGRLLLTVQDIQDELRIGRSSVYALIRSGQLATIHIGRSVRVPRTSLEAWLRDRLAEAD
jgi:excisionase family DNA binding protein